MNDVVQSRPPRLDCVVNNEWTRRNGDIVDWIEANRQSNRFAFSLFGSLQQYGSLTPNQCLAVRKNLKPIQGKLPFNVITDPGTAERLYREHAQSTAKAAGPALDLTSLPTGRYAVPGATTRLKVLVRNVPAGDLDKWAGFIFVSDAAEYGQRKRYGMQRPGRFYEGECINELRLIAADPKAATVAYGKLTSQCGVCGRPLEDTDSVARGIGPVCAAKRGYL